MRPDDFFKNHISKNDIPPVIFFSGSEEYWKKLHIKSIVSLFVGNNNLNVFYYDALKKTPQEIIDEANELGFFTSKKIIVYSNIDKLDTDEQKLLISYISTPNKDTLLILDAPKLNGKTILAKNTYLKNYTIFYEIEKDEDILNFIKYKLKTLDELKINKELEQFLLQKFPSNLRLLSHNIEKMAAHNNYTSPLTMKNTVIINSYEPETDNFAFTDSIVEKNFSKAMHIKNTLTRQKENINALIGLLRWQFQLFLKAKQMLIKNEPANIICSRCKIIPFKQKSTFEYLKNINSFELDYKYKLIADCDFLIKSSNISEEHTFEMLIFNLCK